MASSQSPFGNRRNYDLRIDNVDKDILINQMKAQIFEYEQHEKDYDSLNHKFRNLQNELSFVNEEKLRFEYETKQKLDSLNKRNIDLRAENENLQLNLNDK